MPPSVEESRPTAFFAPASVWSVERLRRFADLRMLWPVQYEWDEAKRRDNLRKHGVDFQEAAAMFTAPSLRWLDKRADYGEDRWVALGTGIGRVLVVVFTEPSLEIVRIISVRKAIGSERKRFFEEVRDRLDAGGSTGGWRDRPE